MTKIKLCGLSRVEDIEVANELEPEYIGFVFVKDRKRYITPEMAKELKSLLKPNINAVGVFIDEQVENVAKLLNDGIIDVAQLHGNETEQDIARLRKLTDKPIIKAFKVTSNEDTNLARKSTADYVLLDSGTGSGITFDWSLIKTIDRPYFLAGGLDAENVQTAIQQLAPFAVDVSSGIETQGIKDKNKMQAFVSKVRMQNREEK